MDDKQFQFVNGEIEMQFWVKQRISEMLEEFAKRPSNSNKVRYNLYAEIEDMLNSEELAKLIKAKKRFEGEES